MNAVDAIDLYIDDSWGHVRDIELVEGGDGTVNYAFWRTSWIVESPIVITAARLGVRGGSFLAKVYSEVEIEAIVANAGDVITVEWKITAT